MNFKVINFNICLYDIGVTVDHMLYSSNVYRMLRNVQARLMLYSGNVYQKLKNFQARLIFLSDRNLWQ